MGMGPWSGKSIGRFGLVLFYLELILENVVNALQASFDADQVLGDEAKSSFCPPISTKS